MDIQLLKVFVAVAESRSFTATADRMGVSQPRISLLVRRLEEGLGFPLFLRTSRSIRLTAEGSEFLIEARKVQEALERAQKLARALQRRHTGRLRIGAPQFSAAIPARTALINEYLLAYPDQAVEISHGPPDELLAALRARELDLIFATTPLDNTPELDMMEIAQAHLCIGMSPEHPLATAAPVPVAALCGVSVAVLPRPSGGELFDAWFGPVADAGASFVECPEAVVSTLIQFGRARGMPILLYRWMGEDPAGLVWRPLVSTEMSMSLVIMWRGSSDARPSAQRFWDIAAGFELDRPSL